MNHLATMRIHDSSIDSRDARRVRKRRRMFHVQKLSGRLSLPPESAKQDKSSRHASSGNGLSAHGIARHFAVVASAVLTCSAALPAA